MPEYGYYQFEMVGWLLELVPETCDILSSKNRRHIIISVRNTVKMLSNTVPQALLALVLHNPYPVITSATSRQSPLFPSLPSPIGERLISQFRH